MSPILNISYEALEASQCAKIVSYIMSIMMCSYMRLVALYFICSIKLYTLLTTVYNIYQLLAFIQKQVIVNNDSVNQRRVIIWKLIELNVCI